MTTNLIASLLGFQILTFCLNIYANVTQRKPLASWSSSAGFVTLATIMWLDNAPHWIVYMLYAIGALQAGQAVFLQVRGSHTKWKV